MSSKKISSLKNNCNIQNNRKKLELNQKSKRFNYPLRPLNMNQFIKLKIYRKIGLQKNAKHKEVNIKDKPLGK